MPSNVRNLGKWAGRVLLAIGSPLLLLALTEAVLVLSDAMYPTNFLLKRPLAGRLRWVDNPYYGYRFFEPTLARNPAPIATDVNKPTNVVRVVVLGESAAQGDPLVQFGLARMLQALLSEIVATARIEVINAAMTAINSSVIVDIAQAMSVVQPDIFVLYIGNNEVIGPYGPGTVFAPYSRFAALTPLRVWLTRWRTTALIRSAWTAMTSSARPPRWQGLQMFFERPIPADDPRLKSMYELFERNIRSILRIARSAGAEAVVCTVAVNLSDCPPFGGEAAREEFNRALELRAAGRTQEAQAAFARARDLDVFRFRADGTLNAILRRVAEDEGVCLADVEKAFTESAEGDRELFVDHVHFTLAGTYRVARTVAECVAKRLLSNEAEVAWPTLEQCRDRLFYTPWSERQLALIMLERRSQPPFQGQPGNAARLDELRQKVNELTAVIETSDLDVYRNRFELLREENADDFFLAFEWGTILSDRGRWQEAAEVFLGALPHVPLHYEARRMPAYVLCRAGRPEEAARVLLGTEPPRGLYVAEYALEIMRLLRSEGLRAEAFALARELLQRARRLPGREHLVAALRNEDVSSQGASPFCERGERAHAGKN